MRNGSKMFSDLVVSGRLNLRAMKNFDVSGDEEMMSKKQVLFMRLVIKDILGKMDFVKLIESAESLKRSDDDMIFRDSFYDFLRKIYKKKFFSLDFKDLNTEKLNEKKAALDMLISTIKISL